MDNISKAELIEYKEFVLVQVKKSIKKEITKINFYMILAIIMGLIVIPTQCIYHNFFMSMCPMVISFFSYRFVRENILMNIATLNMIYMLTQRDLDEVLEKKKTNFTEFSNELNIDKDRLRDVNELF